MSHKPDTLMDPMFDRQVTLRDGYRIMERFLLEALGRGDLPLSDLLHAFVMETKGGLTTDPGMPSDFLRAAECVVGEL